MPGLKRWKIYPSEDQAEAISRDVKFAQILAMTVEDGCRDAADNTVPANVILFRRIGPYKNSSSASKQASSLKKRYHPEVDGTFETHTVVDSRDKNPDRKKARHFLMVHFWPNGNSQECIEDSPDAQ